jgi:DNA-binding transcriptional ArsR family regulator
MAMNPTAGPTPAASAAARPAAAGHEEPGYVIREVGVMRAMSHPARIAILEHLGQNGPATATECAEVVGLSPSATSYHLRALAKVGLIEEAPGRGDARERVWRSTVSDGYTVRTEPDAPPETVEAESGLIDTFLAWEDTRARRYLARRAEEPPEWYDATYMAETVLRVTADEVNQVNRAIQDLLRPYRKRDRPDPPPGARTVSMMIRAFPTDTPL